MDGWIFVWFRDKMNVFGISCSKCHKERKEGKKEKKKEEKKKE